MLQDLAWEERWVDEIIFITASFRLRLKRGGRGEDVIAQNRLQRFSLGDVAFTDRVLLSGKDCGNNSPVFITPATVERTEEKWLRLDSKTLSRTPPGPRA